MLRNELNDALKAAMRAKDSCGVATVRLIMAALKDRDIQARSKGNAEGISDDEILGLLQSMVKQRHDSIEAYRAGNRHDLADREEQEIAVIERFLPKQLSHEETESAVSDAIGETEAAGLKDMGRVMAHLKERYPGRMDFGEASKLVKQRLA